jgi:hypothetical protein
MCEVQLAVSAVQTVRRSCLRPVSLFCTGFGLFVCLFVCLFVSQPVAQTSLSIFEFTKPQELCLTYILCEMKCTASVCLSVCLSVFTGLRLLKYTFAMLANKAVLFCAMPIAARCHTNYSVHCDQNIQTDWPVPYLGLSLQCLGPR